MPVWFVCIYIKMQPVTIYGTSSVVSLLDSWQLAQIKLFASVPFMLLVVLSEVILEHPCHLRWWSIVGRLGACEVVFFESEWKRQRWRLREMKCFMRTHPHTHTSSQVNEEAVGTFVGPDVAELKFRLHFNTWNHRSAPLTSPELCTLQKICRAVCVNVGDP